MMAKRWGWLGVALVLLGAGLAQGADPVFIRPEEMPEDPLPKRWLEEKKRRQDEKARQDREARQRADEQAREEAKKRADEQAREEARKRADEQARQEQARLEQLKRDRFETLLAQLQTSISGGMKRDAERAYQEASGLLPGDGRLNGLKERIARMQERVDPPPPPPPPPPLGGIDFVRVPGGCFQMGSNDGDSDEKPVHEVCVDGFEMGKHEVTQKQWRAVMGSDPPELNFKGCDDCPVERVSWLQVQEFIGKLNGGRSGPYRLPSEAEWEYACRGGRSGETYCGGNDIDRVAWHGGNSEGKTHPVGRKAANGFGLHDMSGNVWEWVSDWYGDNYANSPRNNPKGPDGGSRRVIRGGGWLSYPAYVRSAFRFGDGPDSRYYYLGFRLSRTGP
ncbi:MAG: SUMF1/EgtB/PvdO family nonheme iron enzyme [Magnetococcales bacterium]|nr:SUMF1/EgtB/PvdO family nonheme iron enzyme [Magnetococcales bacterium]